MTYWGPVKEWFSFKGSVVKFRSTENRAFTQCMNESGETKKLSHLLAHAQTKVSLATYLCNNRLEPSKHWATHRAGIEKLLYIIIHLAFRRNYHRRLLRVCKLNILSGTYSNNDLTCAVEPWRWLSLASTYITWYMMGCLNPTWKHWKLKKIMPLWSVLLENSSPSFS